MELKKIIQLIDTFLFAPKPVYSASLLRIGMGILLLINWAMIQFDLENLYGPNGIVSLSTVQEYGNALRFSLFDYLPNTLQSAQFLSIVNLIAVLALTIGAWTRPAIFTAFVTMISFHHRNGYILNSADSVLRITLFFLFFSHCADAYSFDHWRLSAKGLVPRIPAAKSPWALRLIQFQFCVIYVATVFFKIKGDRWVDGSAVYIASRLDEFFRYQFPLLNNMFFVKFFTWSTLMVELALGTLVWIKEFRYWVLLAGICLHLGIEFTMSIPVFEWAMIVLMVSMVDPDDLKNLADKLKSKAIEMTYKKISTTPNTSI